MQDIEIEDTKEYKTAFSSSLRYLTYRARTKKEIINYLTKKGYQDNIIHKIVNKLIDINYINDDEFVINFIYNSMNNQSKGRLSITNELLEKGISEEIINRHIHLYSEDKEIAIANTIACKFFYNNSHLPMKQIKNKLYNRLMRRGFSKNSIDSVFQFL
ncbi:MAG: recombination regulator RecX, partial [Clostridiales bacterium]|nr:recombination regulator RecX [Clostridiales bacterium]